MSQPTELHVLIREEPDGTYWAEVQELPGCFASGHDLEELKDAVFEAVALYLENERPAEDDLARDLGLRVDEMRLVPA